MSVISQRKVPSPASEESNENKGIKSVVQNQLVNSSVYVVSQVGKSTSPIHKIIWLVILATALMLCSIQIYRYFYCYFQYPVVVTLKVEQSPKMAFPAVTICNLNRLDSQFKSCIHENGEVSCIPTKEGTAAEMPNGMVGSPLVVSERQAFMSCRSKVSGLQPKGKDEYLRFLDKYSKVDRKTRRSLGYDCKDIIEECSFNGVKCDCEEFYTFQSFQYGNCFTFNKNNHLGVVPSAYKNGLEVVINMRADQYLPVSHTLGSRIIVHDPADDPHPEESGINISPGYDVTLSLKKTQMIRMKPPYRDGCVDYKPGGPPDMESSSACMQACMQERYYDRCGCTEPTILAISNGKQCNISNATVMCCLDGVLEDLEKFGSPCDCRLPCTTPRYHEMISMAKWPSRSSFYKNVPNSTPGHFGDLKLYRDNFAKVNVYYSTSEILSYEQAPMFEDSELFSHLGGQFGLWLGLSLVAVFELVENVVYLVYYMVTLMRK